MRTTGVMMWPYLSIVLATTLCLLKYFAAKHQTATITKKIEIIITFFGIIKVAKRGM